ncbi:hypothetical protein B0H14DRAFT_1293515 [Mycena olivaceomarginata]|nr:hypothetical protein B0H14DRAFT_1293515 [Mycena olivaceomarginata]
MHRRLVLIFTPSFDVRTARHQCHPVAFATERLKSRRRISRKDSHTLARRVSDIFVSMRFILDKTTRGRDGCTPPLPGTVHVFGQRHRASRRVQHHAICHLAIPAVQSLRSRVRGWTRRQCGRASAHNAPWCRHTYVLAETRWTLVSQLEFALLLM